MLRAGHGLMLIAVALLTIGVVMVNSAGLTVDPQRPVSLEDVLLGRPTILAAIAVVAMLAGSRVRLGGQSPAAPSAGATPALRGGAIPWLAAAVVAVLLAVHVPGIGREVNGARRWIDLRLFTFQPSEIAKWAVPVILAAWAARRAAVMGRPVRGLLAPMALVAVVCGLVVTEDLGTAVLIGLVATALLVAAGARIWHVALLAGPAAAGLVAAVISSPYRLDRLRSFIDPFRDPQGIGYHMIQSMATVAGGGVAGRGLGNSVQKFGYLPEDTTDFVFAIICEELGLVGAAAVIGLFAALLVCGLSILRRAGDPFRRLVGLGILLTIGLQAIINMAVVTGLAPTKGIALPLVSAGGTGWVLTGFCVGLLASMDRAEEPCAADSAEVVTC